MMNATMTEERSTGHVLVVDDDRVNRMLLTRSLEREGHRVRCAENGLEALELLREEPCDVVLLDIVMPELDGVSLLERIKGDPVLHDVRVIMISGVDETDSVVRCIEIGADDYLPKPFDPILLRARISAGLTKKRLHELERDRLRGVFSRFVPEHVVDDVLERTDEDLRLGGSRDVGTVMFADLRGFTGFSESTAPQRVIELLNQYFGEMTDAIFEHGGTLVGYRGDGFLAVFGAPIPLDVRKRRLVAPTRVHRSRRHCEHRGASRDDDQDRPAVDPHGGLDLSGARQAADRSRLRGRVRRARQGVDDQALDAGFAQRFRCRTAVSERRLARP